MNKDGHGWARYWRDHTLSVRPHSGLGLDDITRFDGQPEWARGRVAQFWGGVWKRFLVRGPVSLDMEVGANHSWDTILQAVTLDLVDETPPPYFGTVVQWQAGQAHKESQWRALARRHPAPSDRRLGGGGGQPAVGRAGRGADHQLVVVGGGRAAVLRPADALVRGADGEANNRPAPAPVASPGDV